MVLRIVVRFTFEGVHSWPQCPVDGPTPFLAHPHRHLFHVEAALRVGHVNRDVEFIDLKRRMATYCAGAFAGPHHLSCEAMAVALTDEFVLDRCSVFEDGENGAEVTR